MKCKYKAYCVFLLTFFCFVVNGQDLDQLKATNFTAQLNQKYGNHPRNTFDLLLPKSNKPTALVLYIHGGGFVSGDKSAAYKRSKEIDYFLDHNIAFATINYRFYKNNDSMGVKKCLKDIQTAIQYLKHNATTYNLNKTKFACYGNSAGAGASLYFAFHNDFAVPKDTTLAGESTKLKCAGAISTQATYNLFKWKKIIPNFWIPLLLKKNMFYKHAANFYGYKTYQEFRPYKDKITKSLDMLSMIDASDPPIYLENVLKSTFPSTMNIIQHHQSHAVYLSKILKQNGVPYQLETFSGQSKTNNSATKVALFIVRHLN